MQRSTDDRPRGSTSMAPRVLEPILAQVERIDRTIRHIRPIRPGSVLGIERHRHRGRPVELADGTIVHPGERADIIHFDNRRLREWAVAGWQLKGLRECRDEMRHLAHRILHEPGFDPPLAYTGTSVLAALGQRIGFERHPHPRGRWSWLENWYARTILVRWASEGRGRVLAGHGELELSEVWISVEQLLARYGPRGEAEADQ